MADTGMPATLHFLLAARRSELHGLEVLANTCELVTLAGKLIHALQKERGYSNLYLCGSQEHLLDTLNALSRDAEAVEDEVRAFLARPELDTAGASARLLHGIAYALYRLDELGALRRRIRERRVAEKDATARFTRLVGSLLAVVFEAADSALDADITRILVALLNFMQGKELCGQERACGVIGYTVGHFSDAQKTRMTELVDTQTRCFSVFAQYASADALARWEEVQAQSGRVLRLREMAHRTSDTQPVDPTLAELWFDLCTERIDALRTIEILLAEALAQQCRKRIGKMRRELEDHRLLLRGLGDQPDDATAPMLFSVRGRLLDMPPENGVGDDMARSILDMLQAQTSRLQQADDALQAARSTLEERKRVEKAKWLLVNRYGLSEQAAHERLQRAAMDGGQTLSEIAQRVIAELGADKDAG